MMTIILTKGEEQYNLDGIEGFDIRGSKYQSSRMLTLNLRATSQGLHNFIKPEQGNRLTVFENEKEIYTGIVFNTTESKSGSFTCIANDRVHYLVKNNDNRFVFKNKTASEIINKICADFQIPLGKIADTKYKIPYLIWDGDTVCDIILVALKVTFEQTGVKYYLYSESDQINLVNRSEWLVDSVVIETGVNLINYTLTSSIDDIVTRVKLAAGEENKETIVVSNDTNAQQKYGTLQYFEKVSDKVDSLTLQKKADSILNNKNKPKNTLSVESIGHNDVISGKTIYLIISELQIAKPYYVDEDTHTYKGNSHMMQLTLNESDDLPDLEIEEFTNEKSSGESGKDGNDEKDRFKNIREELLGL